MKAAIFANGDVSDYDFVKSILEKGTILISCDGGVRHTKTLGIDPDYVLGDFDSADKEIINYYKALKIPFIPFPSEKNFSDLELCVNFLLNRNVKEITIFGGTGSRFDHTLANAHILKVALDKGVDARIVDKNTIIQLINKKVILSGKKGDIFSLIPLTTEVSGVRTRGCHYQLLGEKLFVGSSRGISNVFMESEVEVEIEDGLLFVIQSFEF